AERHLVLRDARRDFRIIDPSLLDPVQLVDRRDHIGLPRTIDAGRVGQVEDRIALRAQLYTLVAAGQKATMPLPGSDRLLLARLTRGNKNHEAWQVLVRRS